jgi:hypothetical protein
MTEADGMVFVVDDEAARCHSLEGLLGSVSAPHFLPYGAILGLRLPVREALLLRNTALNSSPNAA